MKKKERLLKLNDTVIILNCMKLCVKVITDDLEVTFSSYVIVMYSLYLTENQGYLEKKTKNKTCDCERQRNQNSRGLQKKKKERKMIINRQSDQRRALRDRHQNHVNGQESTNESPLKMRQ